MKKLKWIIPLLIVVSLVTGVIGCKDPEVEHQHQFTKKWEIDEYYHWKKCNCGEIDFESEHSFGDWQVIKAATEEAEGKQERKCTVCPYTTTEVIEKLAHTHKFATDWTVTKPATEEAEGSKERTCTVCGYTATEAIEKLAHTHKFAKSLTKDSTCHWYATTCTCGLITEVSEIAEHSFGNWTTTKESTEEAEGSKERTCTVCGYTATEAIEKLAHTHKFAEEWTIDSSGHWHAATCKHADETSGFAEHTFGEYVSNNDATTEKDGTKTRECSVCGYEDTVTDEGSKIIVPEGFVLIPAGTFQMGSTAGGSDNKPVHQVTITKSFCMGKYEVTQAEYEKYCSYGGSKPSSTYGDGDNYPAYYVSWYEALVYCNKRSIAEGLTPCYSISGNTDPSKWGDVPTSSDDTWNAVVCDWNANGYRLPTEAEWEYAARAGDNTVDAYTYAGTNSSSELGKYAWYTSNSGNKTHPVGTKKSNAFGLYDMSGNVWEWCWNRRTSSYNTGTEGGSDPTGASSGSGRVRRGGGWRNYSDYCAVFARDDYNPYFRGNYVGFRVVRASSK